MPCSFIFIFPCLTRDRLPGPTLAAAKTRGTPHGSGSGTAGPISGKASGASGARTGGGGIKGDLKVEEENDAKHGLVMDSKRFVLQDTLDYSQYYPTVLPLQVVLGS